jgi:hypothetical protein
MRAREIGSRGNRRAKRNETQRTELTSIQMIIVDSQSDVQDFMQQQRLLLFLRVLRR